MVNVPVLCEFCKEVAGKLQAIIHSDDLWNTMFCKEFLHICNCLGTATLRWWNLPHKGHLSVVVHYCQVFKSIKTEVVSSQVLPGSFWCWCGLEWLPLVPVDGVVDMLHRPQPFALCQH